MKKRFKFDDYEINIIILALVELRNRLLEEGRYTDAVDELIIKMSYIAGLRWSLYTAFPRQILCFIFS